PAARRRRGTSDGSAPGLRPPAPPAPRPRRATAPRPPRPPGDPGRRPRRPGSGSGFPAAGPRRAAQRPPAPSRPARTPPRPPAPGPPGWARDDGSGRSRRPAARNPGGKRASPGSPLPEPAALQVDHAPVVAGRQVHGVGGYQAGHAHRAVEFHEQV